MQHARANEWPWPLAMGAAMDCVLIGSDMNFMILHTSATEGGCFSAALHEQSVVDGKIVRTAVVQDVTWADVILVSGRHCIMLLVLWTVSEVPKFSAGSLV
jgi:hypothetical protein